MSAIPQRPTHVVRRRGLTLCLLLTAALTTGAAMARADALVADITAISSDEARALARTSAAHLGVEEELPIVQESFRLGPLGSHYVVGSTDREHLFWVDAHRRQVVRYENSRLLEDMALVPGQWPVLIPDEIEAQRWIGGRVFPEFDWDQMRYMNGRWRELAAPDVLSGNVLRMVTGGGDRIVVFSGHHQAVTIEAQPALTREECVSKALQCARSWPRTGYAWLADELMGGREVYRYFAVLSDDADVHRLMYSLWLTASDVPRDTWDQLSSRERDRRGTYEYMGVDARTGECVPLADGYAPRLANGELVPFLKLGDESFDTSQPIFPPRIRDGVPYVYVGYLESLIWQGEVEATETSATIRFADTTWAVTADSGSIDADGQQRAFTQQPRTIASYLYLPPEIIKAITGWEVEYVEAENTVYIYSHLQSEKAKAAG